MQAFIRRYITGAALRIYRNVGAAAWGVVWRKFHITSAWKVPEVSGLILRDDLIAREPLFGHSKPRVLIFAIYLQINDLTPLVFPSAVVAFHR